MELARTIPLAALLVAACAGAETTPSVRCDLACERDQRCNVASGSPFCADNCAERMLELRPEFRDSFVACHTDIPCDDEVSTCEVEASTLVDRRPIDENFLDQCQPVQTSCDEGFDSAFCFISHYYQLEAVEAAMGCLALGCTEIEACLRLELPLAPF